MFTAYAVDLSWLLYRSYYSFSHLSAEINGFTKPTGHIFGVLSSIESILKRDPKAYVYLCEDGRAPGKALNPHYKEGRQSLDYNIKQDTELIESLAVLHPQVFVAYNNEAEADHLMYSLARKFSPKNHTVIFSGDDDLLQTLGENVTILRSQNKGKDEFITLDDYMDPSSRLYSKYHGVIPQYLPTYRALVGDHSDNLPGIPRIPRDLVLELCSTIHLDDPVAPQYIPCSKRSHVKYTQQVCDEWSRLHTNYLIMKLNTVPIHQRTFTRDVSKLETYKLSKWTTFLRESGVQV